VVAKPDEVRRRIGLAGQYAAVDPNLTGRENLTMIGNLAQLPRPSARARADELLGRFDLEDAADRPVRTYSGGMRRRLDVAAALVQRPPVVFLDEPTTGLDLLSRNELWEMIRELVSEGSTVLLTTQYLEEADRLADRVAVVNGGKIIADDTPAALKSRLGSTIIEFGLSSPDEAASAATGLAAIPEAKVEQDGSVVRVRTWQASRVLVETVRALDGLGLEPTSVSVREPSLDDVFLALTGSHAGEAPAAGGETTGRRRRRRR